MNKLATIEQLKKALAKRSSQTTSSPFTTRFTIEPTEQPQYPLSSTQSRLYEAHYHAEDSTAYNLSSAIEISGPLDDSKLQEAFSQLIKQHSILRTSFLSHHGIAVQKIDEDSSFSLEFLECSIDEAQKIRDNYAQEFSLDQSPLIRASIIRINKLNHLMLIDMPHIIADGRSLSILLNDLVSFYLDSPPTKPRIQFKDYAVWQQTQLESGAFSQSKDYWTNLLSQEIPPLEFPKNYNTSSKGGIHYFNFPKSHRFQSFLSSYKVTPYIFFMAIYQILISRICQSETIVVGSSSEGRTLPELNRICGPFINTLPIIGHPVLEKPFLVFLEEVKKSCLEGIENQSFPVDQIVLESSQPSNFINTFFDLHQDQLVLKDFSRVELRILPIQSDYSKFPISLEVIDKAEHFECHFEYSLNYFNHDDLIGVKSEFLSLCNDVITIPNSLITDLSPLDVSLFEKLSSNSSKPEPHVPFTSFLDHFEIQVRTNPEAIAATFGSEQVSYKCLDSTSSHIAKQLIMLGVREEDHIAFFMKRNIEFLVAMIASFKVGASYIPLDLNASTENIETLLRLSDAKVLLTQSYQDGISISQHTIGELTKEDAPKIPLSYKPNELSLAYTIFTSGSTGRPKGVTVTHGGMMNHLLAKAKDFQLSNNDVIAQTSSQTFDVSVWQFLVALVVGGRVDIVPEENAWETTALFDSLINSHATIYETVPSHFAIILEELQNNDTKLSLLSLRYLIMNGEPFYSSQKEAWLALHPDTQLANVYGPTECSDDVTHYIVGSSEMCEGTNIPIGSIIQNVNGYILDRYSQLVPYRSKGVLHIEGNCLARGYLNNPRATATSFIPSPFSHSKRMYKTGDLVAFCSHNTIEFFGRLDNQIKINGRRLELGEVEARISQFEGVSNVACTLEKNNGEAFLECYVLLNQNASPHLFFEFLQNHLPAHMMPSLEHIYIVAEFPLLPSGKTNRKILKKLEKKPLFSEGIQHQLPTNDTEEKLFKIWKEILKKSHFGIHSNFFHIGGHSLLATLMMGKILSEFGIKISIRTIYENPTITHLAANIAEKLEENVSLEVDHKIPLIVPDHANRYLPFPMTDIQHAYWLGRKGIFELGNVSVHVYAEYESTSYDISKLENAWNQLIDRHDALRIVFNDDGTQQILETTPHYSIDCLDLSNAPHEDVEREQDAYRSKYSHEVFPADQWPLFAIRSIKSATSTRLYLSFDALIMDGWSVDILFDEWMKLYQNPQFQLPNIDISFRDYILTAKELKLHPQYLTAKQYWTSRLDTFPGPPNLPLKKRPNQISSQSFSRCSKRIPKKAWREGQKVIQEHGMSPTGFLAFLFGEILAKHTDNDMLAINLTLFDRPAVHPQINDIVGDFTSLTLLEVNGKSHLCLEERAKELQARLWEDVDHHLFGGLEFIRALSNHPNRELPSEFPVVLTSVLGLDDQQDVQLEKFFGEEVFSITQTPQVWLDFKAYEINSDLIIEWDYVTELFEEGFIENMHESYCKLFEILCIEPTAWKLPSIQTLPDRSLEQIQAYNRTEEAIRSESLTTSFEKLNEQHLQSSAIVSPNQTLSYGALIEICKKVSSDITELGYPEGSLMAIIMRKDWEQVAAVLSVLKSNYAYLPIDADFPEQRINQILEVSGASGVLTQPQLQSKVNKLPYVVEQENCKVLPVTLDKLESQTSKTSNVPSSLAYVIFTSGSTGAPKGVAITHEAAHNTIHFINRYFEVDHNDTVLALSNLNFDLSVYDIFGLIGVGGKIVFPEQKRHKDPSHWVDLIIKQRVTIWNSVPMFMEMLVEYLPYAEEEIIKSLQSTLRLILLSGDWIPLDLPKKVHTYFPSAQIISLGGATEASIWSVYYPIDPSKTYARSIPYGYPLPNQTLYILDRYGGLTLPFVPGDLYIGGAGLASGYWNDPNKTNQSFIEHPKFGRLYKTGDLGLFNPNIGIEFLGRKDSQVKINGHRIELGEIKHLLNNHPHVEKAHVFASREDSIKQHLFAAVIPKNDDDPSISLGDEVIHDPNLRSSFTLEQKGVDYYDNSFQTIPLSKHTNGFSRKYIRKSFRTFEGALLDTQAIQSWIAQSIVNNDCQSKTHYIRMDDLSRILSSISIIDSSTLLSKYPYPSAGSLYPVQVFFSSNGTDCEIDSGTYYYNPKLHSIIKVSNKPLSRDCRFVLREKKEAIAPLYGKFSTPISTLEAGYMTALMAEASHDIGINFETTFSEESIIELKPSIQTTQYQNVPTVLLYMVNDCESDEKSCWYQYDLSIQQFTKIKSKVEFEVLPELEDTYAILAKAQGGIFFLEPKNALGQESKNFARLLSGYFGQHLMDNGLDIQIGGCPLVRLDTLGKSIIQKVAPDQELLHYFLFGSVSERQLQSNQRSEYTPHTFEDRLESYLKNRLPEYMIPEKIIKLSEFPLTPNGKVDTKFLTKQVSEYASKPKTLKPPKNNEESKLHKIWANILNTDEISIDESFFEAGGNSLLTTQMALSVRKEFGVDIPLHQFFEATTIELLAKVIKQQNHIQVDIDIIEDSKLKEELTYQHPKNRPSKAVLLTGATGFLGSYILNDLLNHTKQTVYCIVRGETLAEAKKKLMLSKLPYSNEELEKRVIPILGDLSQEALGLSDSTQFELENEIGTIIHNGAQVHHIFDYSTLRQTNVLSTTFLLELAAKASCRFIYISSLLSVVDRNQENQLSESFPTGNPEGLYGGYQKTKWVNEMILKQAHQNGLDVSIFRPNTISADNVRGYSSYQSDHFLRLVKGCIQLGYAPIWKEKIDLLPVNIVSKAIVQISSQPNLSSNTYNISSPEVYLWTDLIKWLNNRGYQIELIPPNEWRTEHLANIDETNALYPLLPIYLSAHNETLGSHGDNPMMVAESHHYFERAKDLDLPLPNVSPEYLETLFSYLEMKHFIHP